MSDPIFNCDSTQLDFTDGMNEWRDTATLLMNMTPKHEQEKIQALK